MIAADRRQTLCTVPHAVVLYRAYYTVLGRWTIPFTRASSWTCCSTTCYRADSTPMMLQLDELLEGCPCPRMHPFADEMPQLILPTARRNMRTRAATAARRISTGLVSNHSCLLLLHHHYHHRYRHHHHHHHHLHHHHHHHHHRYYHHHRNHHHHHHHRHQCHHHHRPTAEVFNSAVLRCPTDCAICMLPIHCSQSAAASTGGTVSSGSANRRDVLLSCSHLFHENCILSFERFLTATVVSACISVPTY